MILFLPTWCPGIKWEINVNLHNMLFQNSVNIKLYVHVVNANAGTCLQCIITNYTTNIFTGTMEMYKSLFL